MTSSAPSGTLHVGPERRPRAIASTRLFVRVARSLWLRDRAVAELRWGAVTLTTMALLAIVAKVFDPADRGFDRAILLDVPGALIAVAAGWSAWGARLMERRAVRLALGPAVLLIAMLGTGPMDLLLLAVPSAAPLVVLALTYAAITRGYPIAAAMILVSWIGVGVAHAMAIDASVPVDLVSGEYVVAGSVALLASAGMFLVVRVATEAEGRANRMAARSRARVDALEKLERVVRAFDGSRPVREVIQTVVDDVSREFEITLVSMYLPDDAGRLSMVGVAGYQNPIHVIEMGVGVIGRAAVTQETQFVADVLDDPEYVAARDDVRSEVAAPIVHDGELLGVVNFEGTLAHPMGSTHIAVAEMLARSIAAALRSARLDEERRERLHAIERILEVSRGLVADLDRGRTMWAVVDAAADLLAADRVVVAGRDPDGTFRVEHQTSVDATTVIVPGRPLDAEDDPALEAIDRGTAVIRTVAGEAGRPGRSVLALPIRIGDRVAAVLTASRSSGAPSFGAMELGIADLLVSQVAVALHNAERHATVSDAAVRDQLTGLLNRRYFDEAVESAFATARRAGAKLSLIVLDLDRFSTVNNEHGHPVGDSILRRVARAMSSSVRIGDTVARYGGEEFVVIAPGADASEAVAVAERIRAAIAQVGATGLDGSTVQVTVSAGVASLLGDELDGRGLFRAADSALLAAKRAGRDRVVAV